MADNIFTQLGRLFQSNVIIRKKDDNRLVVRDLDYTQTALKSNFIERYNKMIQKTYTNPYSSAQNQRASYEIRKMDLFRDYELMEQDPIIASALDIYSDESTPIMTNDNKPNENPWEVDIKGKKEDLTWLLG